MHPQSLIARWKHWAANKNAANLSNITRPLELKEIVSYTLDKVEPPIQTPPPVQEPEPVIEEPVKKTRGRKKAKPDTENMPGPL